MIYRKNTEKICIGDIEVGGGASISVQSMTRTDTHDIDATLSQITRLAEVGCDIIRVAVPDNESIHAFGRICDRSPLPVIADVHFDYRLAIGAVEAGAHGLRINPGNIGGKDKVAKIIKAVVERDIPVRVGVNSGSLDPDILASYGSPTIEAIVESTLKFVDMVEELGCRKIKVSAKSSDPMTTVEVYRKLSSRTNYPMHLGVTEAGTLLTGTVRSITALSILLAEGIGDTIRVSLTADPVREVMVALELLRCFGFRPPGPSVISCPTCGRTQVDVAAVAMKVESELERLYRTYPSLSHPVVAVMGCVVNGPGEAREADIAVAGGRGLFALYVRGEHMRTVRQSEVVDELIKEVRNWDGGVSRE